MLLLIVCRTMVADDVLPLYQRYFQTEDMSVDYSRGTYMIILADANKDSQIIRGEGDASAADIYASAYSQDPEFYAFYRSIDAYRNSLGRSGDLMVIDPNNEFFRYLNKSEVPE